MWATSLTPVGVGPISKPLTYFLINFAANTRLPRQPAAAVAASNGGSNNPEQEEGKEISGRDVLWALQRAAAQKKKAKRKNNKRLASSDSDASHREKDSIDYSNVRPLEIKTEWSLKLDELEKRLQELEQTT
ncbi:hypothetical protein DITRI_Ditri11bG0134600 [Diplodiscus trichospermus]